MYHGIPTFTQVDIELQIHRLIELFPVGPRLGVSMAIALNGNFTVLGNIVMDDIHEMLGWQIPGHPLHARMNVSLSDINGNLKDTLFIIIVSLSHIIPDPGVHVT